MMDPVDSQTPRRDAYMEVRKSRISALREELDTVFPGNQGLVLEIGCGHGHYLTAYAEQHPEARCLGIDIVSKRIRKACQKAEKRNLQNLHFLKAEVRELMLAWPERLPLERGFILFPDPWPKKRHIKNRIIQPKLLDDLGRLAAPGTALHFRSDHLANFEWCHETIDAHPQWNITNEIPWPFENPSFFQDLFGEYNSLTALFEEA